MKAIRYDGTQARFSADAPQPTPLSGEALIRVELAALCNTDREIMAGYVPHYNNIMGHEFVGTVVSIEQDASTTPADLALVGKRVVGEINLNCNRMDCPMCSIGRTSQCPQRTVLGIHDKDGCFADYITLPTRLLHAVPDSLPSTQAVFAEPLAAALRITEVTHISPDRPVALLGDGRLAYMSGQVLALTGAPLTVFGLSEEKLKMFEPFAAGTRLLGQSTQPDSSPVAESDQQSYEVVVDATGHPSGLSTALALTRSGGTLIMKSTYASNVEINMSEVVVREISIRGSRCGPFAPALRYLDRGLVKLPEIEIHQPAQFEAAFASHAFKVALDFSGD
ncbi:MAG: alcohol dehydrogenase catalytic domain-containing protein [Coriobacteriia bacterium]|nr:alcohol dehydrogenase catalytic domain-containing protein [Coriobacteriia bacterium]MCL2536735.1 alcohol dehydrogenase catalytic domain-containing protein [Coriobacteriia bacterium]